MTAADAATSHLFSGFRLGSLALRNRIVMAPMETNMADAAGDAPEPLVGYYAARARGGAGMVTVEFTCVDRPAGLGAHVQLSLDSDERIPSHRRLAAAIKAEGARACLQLHHSGRQTFARHTAPAQPVAPSAVACGNYRTVPRALEIDEIESLVARFAEAAARAIEAGYDAIELHGAHGYLLGQFLSPHANKRSDRYGGDEAGRLRFPVEVIAAVKARIGAAPLIYRISAAEGVAGGLTIEDTERLVPHLAAAGLDALHVSTGTGERVDWNVDPTDHPEGWRLPFARRLRAASGLPVIGVGVIRRPETAERALAEGDCDLIALGRALLVDPDWPEKVRTGRADRIVPCTSCNWCIDRLIADAPVACAENPEIGREGRAAPPRVTRPTRAVVVGAGPAGITAALMLDAAGVAVTLFEARDRAALGVQVSGAPPGKEKFLWYRDHLLARLAESGLDLRLGAPASAEAVAALSPDFVAVAVGGRDRPAEAAGLDDPRAVPAWEVLAGDATLSEGPIAVWGGGETGCEAAEFAAEAGREVTLVTAGEAKRLARRAQGIYRRRLTARLHASPRVEILDRTGLGALAGDAVRLRPAEGPETRRPVAQLLVAQGREPAPELAARLRAAGLEVAEIGDCREVRRIGDAVHDADAAVRAFLSVRAGAPVPAET